MSSVEELMIDLTGDEITDTQQVNPTIHPHHPSSPSSYSMTPSTRRYSLVTSLGPSTSSVSETRESLPSSTQPTITQSFAHTRQMQRIFNTPMTSNGTGSATKPRLQLSTGLSSTPIAPTPSSSSTSLLNGASDSSHSTGPFGIGVRRPRLKLESSSDTSPSVSASFSSNMMAPPLSQWSQASSPPSLLPFTQSQSPSRTQTHSQATTQLTLTPQSQSSVRSAPMLSSRAPSHSTPAHASSSAVTAVGSVSQRAGQPAAAASSPASSSTYIPNEDEVLMNRRHAIEQQLLDLELQEQALAAKRRLLKTELRSVEEQLNRPMKLPFIHHPPGGGGVASKHPTGGSSALLCGSAHWAQSFPWDQAALETMQSVFGINSYRISQREVINATMDRKDVFVIMPTGAGKSLLYQLPALLNEGVTLVISPLLSLMEDQVLNLRRVGVESYMLCGTTPKDEAKRIQAAMLDPHSPMRLLYVTPEKLVKSKQFLSKLERMYELGKLVRIVIDEVHCCSSWGHDFRPDYAKLNILKIQFRDVPILAVTATATDNVVQDCMKILSIRGCQFFKCSFNRPNLHFSVRHKPSANKDVAKDMYDYIASIGHLDSSGIIYCYSRKETEELAALLNSLGLSCDYYHADVTPERRERVHHRWVANQVRIVVSTNAFGLGINKPDVRFVLHHTFPAGISMYYQEAGRAGRDGGKAHCCLWYSARDLARQSIRVYAKQDMTSHLYPMAAYGHTVDVCRRVLMAKHFGESLDSSQCGRMCDICELLEPAPGALHPLSHTIVTRDLTEVALSICEYVVDANGGGGAGAVSGKGKVKRRKTTAGTMTQKQLTDECRKRNSAIPSAKDLNRDDCDRLIIELLLQGILKESFRSTAYATNSYIQHDPNLLQALRRGDLLIKLNFVEGVATNLKETKRKRSSTASSSSSLTQSMPFTVSSESEFDELEEAEIELDSDDNDYSYGDLNHSTPISSHTQLRPVVTNLLDGNWSESSEDAPIVRKRLKQGEKSRVQPATLVGNLRAAEGTNALTDKFRSTINCAKQKRSMPLNGYGDTNDYDAHFSIPDSDEEAVAAAQAYQDNDNDEAVYQAMLLHDAQQFR